MLDSSDSNSTPSASSITSSIMMTIEDDEGLPVKTAWPGAGQAAPERDHGPFCRTPLRVALVDRRHASIQLLRQENRDSGRCANFDLRSVFLAGRHPIAILEVRLLAGIRTDDLITDFGRSRVGHRDWT